MVELGYPPVLLVTLPPTKASRHSDYADLTPIARRFGIRVLEAADANSPAVLEALRGADVDYMFVIGWSQLLTRDLIQASRRGAIGYHPSPLPRLRGRAVIAWTILLGLQETASTLFWIDEGVDSGDILAQERVLVTERETAGSLLQKHYDAIERMLSTQLPLLAQGQEARIPQDHSAATYCAKRTPLDGFIDWTKPASEVGALVRAATRPYPGAFTSWRGRPLIIWTAELHGPGPYIGMPGQVQAVEERGVLVQCGDGNHLRIQEVGFPGEASTEASKLLKNHERLGFPPGFPVGPAPGGARQ